jgi:hypothetical protein
VEEPELVEEALGSAALPALSSDECLDVGGSMRCSGLDPKNGTRCTRRCDSYSVSVER